jgi:hypothetical protein
VPWPVELSAKLKLNATIMAVMAILLVFSRG